MTLSIFFDTILHGFIQIFLDSGSMLTNANNFTTSPLLEELNDISLPDPVGWWPLAFSWWIMLLSVTSILIGIAWYFIDLRRRNAYRKEALHRLQKIMDNPSDSENPIQQINRLLKQVALTAYGRTRVASLKNEQWLRFLQENASYIQQPENLSQILLQGYGPAKRTQPEALQVWHDYAKKWIKGHHQ